MPPTSDNHRSHPDDDRLRSCEPTIAPSTSLVVTAPSGTHCDDGGGAGDGVLLVAVAIVGVVADSVAPLVVADGGDDDVGLVEPNRRDAVLPRPPLAVERKNPGTTTVPPLEIVRG